MSQVIRSYSSLLRERSVITATVSFFSIRALDKPNIDKNQSAPAVVLPPPRTVFGVPSPSDFRLSVGASPGLRAAPSNEEPPPGRQRTILIGITFFLCAKSFSVSCNPRPPGFVANYTKEEITHVKYIKGGNGNNITNSDKTMER